jgi:hypothetical protein
LETGGSQDAQPGDLLLKDLRSLSGKEALDRFLEREDAPELVARLPEEDFFWLVKKVGKSDCLPLLEMATDDQWQYLLDLESWQRDRLDLEGTGLWLERLQQAAPDRLARWFLQEENPLAYYYLMHSLQVVIGDEEEVYGLKEGFVSFDGILHVRPRETAGRETIERLLKAMAREDFLRYQALLLGLASLLPAETEEEMYRLRNVRLSEHGFLPLEEAISVYAPLAPEGLGDMRIPGLPGGYLEEDLREKAPAAPMLHTQRDNILVAVASRSQDPLFLDRLRMEFAGLCNQIISAEGLPVEAFDDLVGVCRKAGGYLNVALERLCGKDWVSAERTLRTHPLVSLFRVGHGLALQLKWEAERWLRRSWFQARGYPMTFWGETWGGMLSGLSAKRPMHYAGFTEGSEYRDFQWLAEIREGKILLQRLMALDGLLERLAELYPPVQGARATGEVTFRSLLFNLWARLLLEKEPSFSALSPGEARRFFGILRSNEKGPPYGMPGFGEAFIDALLAQVPVTDSKTEAVLIETLSLVWQEFTDEYADVDPEDLDGRYSGFISIGPDDGSVPR